MNVQHNFAVQRYSKPPFNLKTNVSVVSHHEGFMATVEWKWSDPSQNKKPVISVTVGVHAKRKMALSEAYRSMLVRQKWAGVSNLCVQSASFDAFLSAGKFSDACSLLVREEIPWRSISMLWKNVIAKYDDDLTKKMIEYFTPKLTPIQFEEILQQVVFLSNPCFVNRTIRLLETLALVSSEGGIEGSSDTALWKDWKILLALEEHASLKAAGSLQAIGRKIQIDSIHLPQLNFFIVPDDIFQPDSLVLLVGSHFSLVGRVTQTSPTHVSVELLTDEAKHDNSFVLAEHIECILLTETRVTFQRISDALRSFFGISFEKTHSFSPKLVALLKTGERKPHLMGITLPPLLGLSPAQQRAVKMAASSRLSLIHGPPGTGKTHTLAALVKVWMSENGKILCCADSNAATDNIYRSLRNTSRVYRLHAGKGVDEENLNWLTEDGQYALVAKYRNSNNALWARRAVEEACVKMANVVVTTLASSRSFVLDRHVFTRVIIDEAAQSIEPAVYMAISRGCEQLVLVGDHKQLPPVVLSARTGGLTVSLFERLHGQVPSTLLNVQRRMHPEIADFPNKAFYQGQVENEPRDQQKEYSPVMFIDTNGSGGGEDLVGTSTRNLGESAIVKLVVDQLLSSKETTPDQVGIIVPYLAQKGHLKRTIPGIQIDTVEGFQGHEKDYIVISTVRSNAVGALGFLSDDRRMNVMLTRAKKGLIVIGDQKTLASRGHTWADWVEWCKEKNCIIALDKVITGLDSFR